LRELGSPDQVNCPLLERFSDRGRQVVVSASDEAAALGHDYVGSEHLLLAVAEDEGETFLGPIGVTPERIRSLVVRIFGRGEAARGGRRGLRLTPHAKSSLQRAVTASIILGQKAVDPEHILIALVIERDGGAARILRECDASPGEVRAAVVRELATRRSRWTDS
jgi:ATP-dependent Clp protease ATP-binding subunit ClpC